MLVKRLFIKLKRLFQFWFCSVSKETR